jgi:hypothetical protein
MFILLTVLIQTHQNGTRVFYWDVNGTIKYGTVESTSRMTDVSLLYLYMQQLTQMLHVSQGTQAVNVKVDGGITVSLPYVTIILVIVLFLLF